MKHLFNNISKKIQIAAIVLFFAGIIVSFLSYLIVAINIDEPLLICLYWPITALGVVLVSWIVYGFGIIVAKSEDETTNKYNKVVVNEKESADEVKVDSINGDVKETVNVTVENNDDVINAKVNDMKAQGYKLKSMEVKDFIVNLTFVK